MKRNNNLIGFRSSNKQLKFSSRDAWKYESLYKYRPLFSYKKLFSIFFKKTRR
ncbi:hypothetical protein [Bacillus bingmayongensis]|uniref:Uncharacterized protein n=1 Tax=Bacillus bingmayongensis TaxID=1150157 RepID=A0ABU5K1F7_9BACI|nr:hypothetical protein [Bacillus bingmayongensis]MBY0599010.1 hypothetical protein [Bacillus bingmayongensis]MDZ5609505.1 hypothetical protein [Bacillus pseudomycoides]